MAKRKRTRKNPFWNSLGRTAVKGTAGAGLGAAVGVVEETVSEDAASYLKAAIAVAGVVGEMFIDPAKSPILAEGAKASLYSGTALGGYELGKKAGRAAKETKYQRDLDRMRSELREDMSSSDRIEGPADVIEIPKKTRRKSSAEG